MKPAPRYVPTLGPLVALMVTATGCNQSPAPETPAEKPAPPAVKATPAEATPAEATAAEAPAAKPEAAPTAAAPTAAAPTAAALTPTGCGPMDALYAMDQRTPVPLQPMMAHHQKQNMVEHLVAIQRIIDGAAQSDWTAVAEAAALIGTSPQMQQMCRHMGMGAPGFTDDAMTFHRRADGIAAAARAKDGPAVLKATSETLKACNACHLTYRQDVVDAATWQARTGSAHQPNPGMHHAPPQ